jgi:hypothetical protein
MVDNMTTSAHMITTHGTLSKQRCNNTLVIPKYRYNTIFFNLCEDYPGIEAQFVAFLDDWIKGDTTTLCSPDCEKLSSHKKKRDFDDDNI